MGTNIKNKKQTKTKQTKNKNRKNQRLTQRDYMNKMVGFL
jgi:hypothetical protein